MYTFFFCSHLGFFHENRLYMCKRFPPFRQRFEQEIQLFEQISLKMNAIGFLSILPIFWTDQNGLIRTRKWFWRYEWTETKDRAPRMYGKNAERGPFGIFVRRFRRGLKICMDCLMIVNRVFYINFGGVCVLRL